jgi:biopolymer transport protein TolR
VRLGGLGGGRSRRRHLYAEVNVINLVDVVLVLLIIFMVTAPIMLSGVKVRLPRAVAQPLNLKEQLVVTITNKGEFAIGDQAMSLARFRAAFRARIGVDRPKGVAIRMDKDAHAEWILQLIELVKAEGIQEVGLVAEQPRNR